MIRDLLGVALGAGLFLALLYFGFHAMQSDTFKYSTWMGVCYMAMCFFASVAVARMVSGGGRNPAGDGRNPVFMQPYLKGFLEA